MQHNFHDHRPLIAFLLVLATCLIIFFGIPYGIRKHQERQNYYKAKQCHPTDEKKTTIVYSGKTMIPVTYTLWRCDKNGETFWK